MARKTKFKCNTWMNTDQIAAALAEAVIEPKAKAAAELEAEAKKSMIKGGVRFREAKRGPKRKGKRRIIKIHIPSAPGTPPHAQTTIGKGSIKFATDNGGITYIVGPSSPPAPYMAVHEFGGRFHPPRPFMRPALSRVIPRFPKMFGKLALSKTKGGRQLAKEASAWRRKHQK